jgi:sigma-B regulation protein RsbU (phosphoserine phosphatase)
MPTISEEDLNRLRGSVDELSALNEIAVAIDSTMSVQEITKLILNHCLRRVKASQGAVFLLDDSVPSAVTFERAAIDAVSGLPIHLNESLKGWIAANKQILLMNQPDSDSRFSGVDFAKYGIRSILAAPLVSRHGLIGVLALFNKEATNGFSEDDRRFLGIVGTQTGKVIENAQLHERELQLQILEKEMRVARTIQMNYLPQSELHSPGVWVVGMSEPARDVGGDFYDIFQVDSRRIFLSLGDVAGKGIPAALMASGCQAVIRALVRRNHNMSLAQLAQTLNAQLLETTEPDQFVTLFLAVYDTETHSLQYLNAGHVPPAVFTSKREHCRLTTGGPLVGVVPETTYEAGEHQLEPGETLFVCSDGVTENRGADDADFGEERLCEFLSSRCDRPPDEMKKDLLRALTEFRRGSPQSDDITFLVLRAV